MFVTDLIACTSERIDRIVQKAACYSYLRL